MSGHRLALKISFPEKMVLGPSDPGDVANAEPTVTTSATAAEVNFMMPRLNI